MKRAALQNKRVGLLQVAFWLKNFRDFGETGPWFPFQSRLSWATALSSAGLTRSICELADLHDKFWQIESVPSHRLQWKTELRFYTLSSSMSSSIVFCWFARATYTASFLAYKQKRKVRILNKQELGKIISIHLRWAKRELLHEPGLRSCQ